MISNQSKQIEDLKSQIDKLELNIKEKDEIINSISPMRDELAQHISDAKRCKEDYKKLIDEIRKMKEVLNKTIYKGRWNLVKLLIK